MLQQLSKFTLVVAIDRPLLGKLRSRSNFVTVLNLAYVRALVGIAPSEDQRLCSLGEKIEDET